MGITNLALKWLTLNGDLLNNYDGLCVDLAGNVVEWRNKEFGDGCRLLYMEPRYNNSHIVFPDKLWYYHAVILDQRGMIHDAWHPKVRKMYKYLSKYLSGQYVLLTASPGDNEERIAVWTGSELDGDLF